MQVMLGLQWSTESKIIEFNKIWDKLEDQSSMLDIVTELLARVKRACDLDSVPMLKLASVFVVKFFTGDNKQNQKFASFYELREKALSAVEEYEVECQNPAPDLVYRRTLRDRMFKANDAYTAAMKAL